MIDLRAMEADVQSRAITGRKELKKLEPTGFRKQHPIAYWWLTVASFLAVLTCLCLVLVEHFSTDFRVFNVPVTFGEEHIYIRASPNFTIPIGFTFIKNCNESSTQQYVECSRKPWFSKDFLAAGLSLFCGLLLVFFVVVLSYCPYLASIDQSCCCQAGLQAVRENFRVIHTIIRDHTAPSMVFFGYSLFALLPYVSQDYSVPTANGTITAEFIVYLTLSDHGKFPMTQMNLASCFGDLAIGVLLLINVLYLLWRGAKPAKKKKIQARAPQS